MNSYPWEGFVLLDNVKFTFHELEDTFKTFEKKIVLTMNQEKARNLTLYLSNPDLRNSLITKIRFFYSNQERTGELNHNSIIQDIYQEVIKWIAVCIDNKEDGIINTDQEEIYDESKALPKNTKNTNLIINIHQKECWEMKAHSTRLGVKKYDLPVSVGKNSKENIQSSNTLQNYQPMQHMQHMQQLMTDISNCKSNVDLNQSIPKSVLVVYFILSSLTINEAEASKLRTFFTLKYLTKHDKDADDNFLQISHDEEKNPGPIAFSVKLRPALKYLVTKLLKIFVEKQAMKCPNNLWTTKAGFYLYDHSTEKVYSCTYKSIEIEALIDILIVCCQKKSLDITNLKEQVLAWTSCKFDRLVFLHYISIVSLHLLRTTQHAERDAVDKKMEKLGVKLDYTTFQNWLSNSPVIKNRKKADLSWEAFRCMVSILCGLVNKESKMGKYASPPDWSAEYEKFQNPYNEKGGHDIKIFFKDLLDYCSKRDQGNWIPQEFKSYIKACEAWIKDHKQQKDLLQEYVLHHDVTVIKENLRFLQSVCSAQSLCNVISMLGERGIYLLSDTGRTVSLQSDPAFTLMKRKYKDLETTEKKYVKMPRYNAEISGLETAQKHMAILKASDAKVSPKERKLRTKTEMRIIFDDELCKVITHGYKPDFSKHDKFKEVPYPNVQKKQEQESSEESKYEHQHEHGMLIETIGDEPEEKTNSDISNPRDTCITKENKDCEYTFENCATCDESENYLGKIPELEDFAEISTIKPVNTSTLEMTSGISSPGQAEIEENSSNIASNNNNLNYEYHDDNISDNTNMNIDSTNDGMDDGIYLSTETVTRGSSSAISDQSNVISEIDFWFADKTI